MQTERKPSGSSRRTEPFFTMPKSALDLIRSRVDGGHGATCIAVFCALRWAANDARQPDGPLTISVNEIARRAGVCYKTAEKAVGILKALEIVHVSTQTLAGTKLCGPSIYTLSNNYCALSKTDPTCLTESIKEGKESKNHTCDPSASPPVAEKISSRSPNVRPRNPLLDALATLNGSNPEQVTATAWTGIGKALAEIRGVCPDVTLEDITRRSVNYRAHFPQATITAHALAKHWALCDAPQGVRGIARSPTKASDLNAELPEPDGWRDYVRANCVDASQAERAWASFGRTERVHIRNEMARQANGNSALREQKP